MSLLGCCNTMRLSFCVLLYMHGLCQSRGHTHAFAEYAEIPFETLSYTCGEVRTSALRTQGV